MSSEQVNSHSVEPTLPGGQLQALSPATRLLWIGAAEPSWVSIALRLDAEGCTEPRFQWVSEANEALALLRRQSFDCVLVAEMPTGSQSTESCRHAELLKAIRTTGCDDPLVLLTARSTADRYQMAFAHDCELLVTTDFWESAVLVETIKRAIFRAHLVRENHQLQLAHQRRLVRERDEAEQLMHQQRQMIQELEAAIRGNESARSSSARELHGAVGEESRSARCSLPTEIDEYYHELLRTYVIMGSGSLGTEITDLAELLAVAELSPRETLELHLERVESLVRGLGNRSARHVIARADLLALELMMHLAECYQKRRQPPSADAEIAR